MSNPSDRPLREFAPVDTDAYPVVKKAFKIHERPVLGFHFYYDAKLDQNMVITIASDSVRTWAANSFGDEVDLMPLKDYSKIRCGSQSYDVHPSGKYIIVVDTMNILHVIKENEDGSLEGSLIDEGLMQILFCRFTPDKQRIFSINFEQGMQSFDLEGKNPIRKPLENKKHVSAVAYSPHGKYLALGYETGLAEIRDSETWDVICNIENVHFKKIRVVEFSHDDHVLLIGCDDKTLTTHSLLGTMSIKSNTFSYHTAPVLSAAFDYASDSFQFASSSADQRVILWETSTAIPLQVFQQCFDEQVVTCVNFIQNGRYLFSGTANGNVIIHKISSIYEEPKPKEIQVIEERMVETKMEEEVKLEIYENDMEDLGTGGLENVDVSDSEDEADQPMSPDQGIAEE